MTMNYPLGSGFSSMPSKISGNVCSMKIRTLDWIKKSFEHHHWHHKKKKEKNRCPIDLAFTSGQTNETSLTFSKCILPVIIPQNYGKIPPYSQWIMFMNLWWTPSAHSGSKRRKKRPKKTHFQRDFDLIQVIVWARKTVPQKLPLHRKWMADPNWSSEYEIYLLKLWS